MLLWEQEGSSVWLLLSMCSLVGLEGVLEGVAAQPVCVFAPIKIFVVSLVSASGGP